MGEHDALLWNILSEPADDTARLVYADWCDENHREAVAAFIRGQGDEVWGGFLGRYEDFEAEFQAFDGWNLAGFGREEDDPRRPYMRFAVGWQGERPRIQEQARLWFTRGFLERIELPCADFLAHAEAIFRAHPVTAVRLTDRRPQDHAHARADGNGFGWCGSAMSSSRACDVPLPLIRIMRQSPRLLNRSLWLSWADFESEQIAQEELSAACVTDARDLVGLPALKPQPEPVPA